MSDYRIIQNRGLFYIQKNGWLGWDYVECMGASRPMEMGLLDFSTQQCAESYIKNVLCPSAPVVVKEI